MCKTALEISSWYLNIKFQILSKLHRYKSCNFLWTSLSSMIDTTFCFYWNIFSFLLPLPLIFILSVLFWSLSLTWLNSQSFPLTLLSLLLFSGIIQHMPNFNAWLFLHISSALASETEAGMRGRKFVPQLLFVKLRRAAVKTHMEWRKQTMEYFLKNISLCWICLWSGLEPRRPGLSWIMRLPVSK